VSRLIRFSAAWVALHHQNRRVYSSLLPSDSLTADASLYAAEGYGWQDRRRWPGGIYSKKGQDGGCLCSPSRYKEATSGDSRPPPQNRTAKLRPVGTPSTTPLRKRGDGKFQLLPPRRHNPRFPLRRSSGALNPGRPRRRAHRPARSSPTATGQQIRQPLVISQSRASRLSIVQRNAARRRIRRLGGPPWSAPVAITRLCVRLARGCFPPEEQRSEHHTQGDHQAQQPWKVDSAHLMLSRYERHLSAGSGLPRRIPRSAP